MQWDHPHACGDKSFYIIVKVSNKGSSPRVWGQAPTKRFIVHQIRIIPTRVGTREILQKFYPMKRDHPHACGDKKKSSYCLATVEGSSPRVWGQAPNVGINNIPTGIIPTRVGTSHFAAVKQFLHQDHPHACGDKFPVLSVRNCALGSSPRVWGQGVADFYKISACGIIPTRVGTSTVYLRWQRNHGDHPHACGDKTDDSYSCGMGVGSSPRVWGQVRR